jgi:hypothetical protein
MILSRCSSVSWLARQSVHIMYTRRELQGEYKKEGQDQSALAKRWDTSKRKGQTKKDLADGAGCYWVAIMDTRQGLSQLRIRARTN